MPIEEKRADAQSNELDYDKRNWRFLEGAVLVTHRTDIPFPRPHGMNSLICSEHIISDIPHDSELEEEAVSTSTLSQVQ